jgi:hypothetical protein
MTGSPPAEWENADVTTLAKKTPYLVRKDDFARCREHLMRRGIQGRIARRGVERNGDVPARGVSPQPGRAGMRGILSVSLQTAELEQYH